MEGVDIPDSKVYKDNVIILIVVVNLLYKKLPVIILFLNKEKVKLFIIVGKGVSRGKYLS